MKQLIMAVMLILFIQSADLLAYKSYELYCDRALLEESEKIALTQIGITERTNRNDGEVEKYLQAVGLEKGNPYCTAGIYWCFAKAAEILKYDTKAIPIPKTGLVANIINYTKQHGKQLKRNAEKHSLLVWLVKNKRQGHIERIYQVRKAGWVDAIGFNTTSPDKSVKKEGVYMKSRNILHPLGRLRFAALINFRSEPYASL